MKSPVPSSDMRGVGVELGARGVVARTGQLMHLVKQDRTGAEGHL